MMRSHYCGQLNESLEGQEITLCGWVHRRRDHGGVIFLDIRDRDGLAQVVFDPDRAETFAAADRVRSEYVVKITGKVRLRPAGAANANMASGMIEVLGYELEVLNEVGNPAVPAQRVLRRRRRNPPALSLPRPASSGNAREAASAFAHDHQHPSLPGRERLPRRRDADPDPRHAGRRSRLPGAEPYSRRFASSPCRNRRSCSSNC